MAKTVSLHCGNTFSERHNFDKDFRAREEHIDPGLSDRNIELEHIPLAEAYKNLFSAARDNYNKKQVEKGHPERQMQESYLAHLQSEKSNHRHNIAYEMIIQIGDRRTTGIENDDREVDILTEYYKSFKERNSENMCVTWAVIHRDEINGTTHMHLGYIPVAHGCKRGLEVQNSLTKALKEQGLETDKDGTAQKKWTERERLELERITREHGVEVEHKNERREHLEKERFILFNQNQEISQELDLKRGVLEEVSRELDSKRAELDKKERELRGLAKNPLKMDVQARGLKKDMVSRADYDALARQANAIISAEKGVSRRWESEAYRQADRAEKAVKSRDMEHERRLELEDRLQDKGFLKIRLRELEKEHNHGHERDYVPGGR